MGGWLRENWYLDHLWVGGEGVMSFFFLAYGWMRRKFSHAIKSPEVVPPREPRGTCLEVVRRWRRRRMRTKTEMPQTADDTASLAFSAIRSSDGLLPAKVAGACHCRRADEWGGNGRRIHPLRSTARIVPCPRPLPPPFVEACNEYCVQCSPCPSHAYTQQRSGNKTTKIAKVKKDVYEGVGGEGGEGVRKTREEGEGAANWSMSRREGKPRPGEEGRTQVNFWSRDAVLCLVWRRRETAGRVSLPASCFLCTHSTAK